MTSKRTVPPSATKIPYVREIHGETVVDNYFWLREKDSPQVRAYLEAENAYTDEVMAGTERLRESLYEEMLARIQETDLSVPYRFGRHLYYHRTEKGKQYAIHCRREGQTDAPETVTLDLNSLAEGHKFLGLGGYVVSDDGNLLAYSLDFTGFRQYELRFRDLTTGEDLPDRIQRTNTFAWSSDGRTLFYVVEDDAKRPYRVYRHRLGSDDDELVFEETDSLYRLWIGRSLDLEYLFITSASSTTSEVRYLKSSLPGATPSLLLERHTDHEYYATHHENRFYIRTNRDGRNFKIVSVPVHDPSPANWEDFVPYHAETMIEDIELFERHALVSEREDGLPHLRVIDLTTRAQHRISMPEPVYSLAEVNNREYRTTKLRFSYQSFLTPMSVFEYDMNSRGMNLLKQVEVLGDFDSGRYTSARLYAMADDGTRIPLSLFASKDYAQGRRNPVLLYGYGSYGYPLPIQFSSSRLSLIDRGVVFVIAHVRGGGELGQTWHDAGKMMTKMNTFTDFIRSAEMIRTEGWAGKIIIEGGSAGGLLVGAVTNLRPELFDAVLSHVPFVDVMNTMLDPDLPLTVGEYLEWGNPNVASEYAYMKAYCPYSNLEAKPYPPMLIKTSLNDSQVMYWEPAKYVAKLRSLKTDQQELLLKTNMDAGHGGASGRYDALRELAFNYAWLFRQFGIPGGIGNKEE